MKLLKITITCYGDFHHAIFFQNEAKTSTRLFFLAYRSFTHSQSFDI